MATTTRRFVFALPPSPTFPIPHARRSLSGAPFRKSSDQPEAKRAREAVARASKIAEPVVDLSLNGDRFTAATGYVAPDWRRLVANLAADPTPYAEWLASAAEKT